MKGHVMDSAVNNLMVDVIAITPAMNMETVAKTRLNFVAMNLHPDTILPRLPFFLNLQTFPLGLAPLHHTMTYTLLNQDQELT